MCTTEMSDFFPRFSKSTSTDFSSESLQAKGERRNILQVLKKWSVQNSVLRKAHIYLQGLNKDFAKQTRIERIVVSSQTLEMFKDVLHT